MKNKIEKGDYGYRTAHRRRQIVIVGLFLALIAALLIARHFMAEGGLRNLVTISAVLTTLPMANMASPLIAALKIPEITETFHSECKQYEDRFPILYDLIITSQDMILPFDAAAIHPSGVYLYCPDEKADGKKAEKFLNEMLIKWKLDGNAKVMTGEKNFFRRLGTLPAVTDDTDDGSAPYVAKLLKSLSM